MTIYIQLLLSFLKIGAFTFGGGYAMIPLIRKEVVDRKKWLAEGEFIDMLAIAQSAPGPISLNTAVFVGNRLKGIKGSLFAGLGIILPSFVIILLIALVFTEFKDNPGVERVFRGIRPAVVALIAAPVWNMAKSAGITWRVVWIPVVSTLAIWLGGLSPVYVVAAAIVAGLLCYAMKWRKYRGHPPR